MWQICFRTVPSKGSEMGIAYTILSFAALSGLAIIEINVKSVRRFQCTTEAAKYHIIGVLIDHLSQDKSPD